MTTPVVMYEQEYDQLKHVITRLCADANAKFVFNTRYNEQFAKQQPIEPIKDVISELPAGFSGDPRAAGLRGRVGDFNDEGDAPAPAPQPVAAKAKPAPPPVPRECVTAAIPGSPNRPPPRCKHASLLPRS